VPFSQAEAEQWDETLKNAAVTCRPTPIWHDGFDSEEEQGACRGGFETRPPMDQFMDSMV